MYQLVPIARLDQDGDMARLARAFVPPCLNLSASDTLTQLLRRVRDELMGRSRQLEVFKPVSQGGAQVQEPDASHANLLLALSMLNRYGPLIHHLLETPQVHPWQAYGVLRQLVGELSTFSERYDMLGETRDGRQLIPPYRHDDPGPGFQALASLVSTLLNEIAAAPEMMVRLEPSGPGGDGLYTAELPEGFFGNRHRYYLVVRGDFDPVVMATALPHDAKLAAPDLVETLVTRSLPGVELLHLADPPRGIPRRPGSLYFRVDTLSDAWDGLERAQQAALFLPSTASNLQAELIVTKG
jgi:type VI secretion system protein ImpJ